jgi:hypothetical protein
MPPSFISHVIWVQVPVSEFNFMIKYLTPKIEIIHEIRLKLLGGLTFVRFPSKSGGIRKNFLGSCAAAPQRLRTQF